MPAIDRVFQLSTVADARSAYDDWAENYEKDMTHESQDYAGPAIVADYVLRVLGTPTIGPNVTIMDAGCGTGLVGKHLNRLGAVNLDGVDLSSGMLSVARRTGFYKSLQQADLSQPLALPDRSYDVVVCVGTLTQGHVKPEAIDELVRITKSGGFMIGTVREAFWAANGYEAKVRDLEKAGAVKIVSTELENYRPGAGVKAVVFVLEVK